MTHMLCRDNNSAIHIRKRDYRCTIESIIPRYVDNTSHYIDKQNTYAHSSAALARSLVFHSMVCADLARLCYPRGLLI